MLAGAEGKAEDPAEAVVLAVEKPVERAAARAVENNCPQKWLEGDLPSGVLF